MMKLMTPSTLFILKKHGGESGIRTHVTLSSKHAFQACAFSHSAISPAENFGRNDSFPGSYRTELDFTSTRFVSFYGQGRGSANRQKKGKEGVNKNRREAKHTSFRKVFVAQSERAQLN